MIHVQCNLCDYWHTFEDNVTQDELFHWGFLYWGENADGTKCCTCDSCMEYLNKGVDIVESPSKKVKMKQTNISTITTIPAKKKTLEYMEI